MFRTLMWVGERRAYTQNSCLARACLHPCLTNDNRIQTGLVAMCTSLIVRGEWRLLSNITVLDHRQSTAAKRRRDTKSRVWAFWGEKGARDRISSRYPSWNYCRLFDYHGHGELPDHLCPLACHSEYHHGYTPMGQHREVRQGLGHEDLSG